MQLSLRENGCALGGSLLHAEPARDSLDRVGLIVGGDAPTRSMVRFLLESNHCMVHEVDGVAALAGLASRAPAVIVFIATDSTERTAADLFAARWLWKTAHSFLLIRTVAPDLQTRAFACGIRSIVRLPVRAGDLQRRFCTVLGSTPEAIGAVAKTVSAGGLTLSPSTSDVHDDRGWSARLTRRESALLQVLMAVPGCTVQSDNLITTIWGPQTATTPNNLAALVRRVRAKIAHPHGARQYIHTDHAQGYRFDARSRPRREDDLYGGPGPRVLVIDDDRATVEMVTDVLQQAGYSVICGAGTDAPMLARRAQPHVILLDIGMPEMDGPEIRRHLRANSATASIPVIAFSASSKLRERVAEMGPDDYLAKPFDIDELLLRIGRWSASPASVLGPQARPWSATSY